jgi:hypothetical protein
LSTAPHPPGAAEKHLLAEVEAALPHPRTDSIHICGELVWKYENTLQNSHFRLFAGCLFQTLWRLRLVAMLGARFVDQGAGPRRWSNQSR